MKKENLYRTKNGKAQRLCSSKYGCKQWLPVENFYQRWDNTHDSMCVPCKVIYNRKLARKRRDEYVKQEERREVEPLPEPPWKPSGKRILTGMFGI